MSASPAFIGLNIFTGISHKPKTAEAITENLELTRDTAKRTPSKVKSYKWL